MSRQIICTVTNDLSYDQRMQRICSTLVSAGYDVTLVGRILPGSVPLDALPFKQKRLHCRFRKGFLFYGEYNIRLFAFLLSAKFDAVCSVDLDTLPAGCLASLIRRKKRVFDAHEYFTEVPEVVNRPLVKAFWSVIAWLFLRFYAHAYTVGPALAKIFQNIYKIPFRVVRNTAPPGPPIRGGAVNSSVDSTSDIPWDINGSLERTKVYTTELPAELFTAPSLMGGLGGAARASLLYQGALNEGRGIEQLLLAMQQLENLELWLAGEGDLSENLRRRAASLGVQERVKFLGFVKPADLKVLTTKAWLGLNLLQNKGLSYYYSLANKFFDYVQAGKPMLTMDFPEYRALNEQHEVAVLIKTLEPDAIVQAVRYLQEHPAEYERLQENCRLAAGEWNWEHDSHVLLDVWRAVFD